VDGVFVWLSAGSVPPLLQLMQPCPAPASRACLPNCLFPRLPNRLAQVSSDDAVAMARRLALEEGLLVGISSGAAVVAAVEVRARRLGLGLGQPGVAAFAMAAAGES
jgi:hypothetical protein